MTRPGPKQCSVRTVERGTMRSVCLLQRENSRVGLRFAQKELSSYCKSWDLEALTEKAD